MTDRDRLLELLHKAPKGRGRISNYELANYLLANGVIVPPCKVGQVVWYVDDFTEEIEECKVYGFSVVNGKINLFVDNGECKFVTRKWHNTKEEAEEKLKELN